MGREELDPKEEQRLWEEYKKKGSLEAREKIIIAYAPLVKYIATQMAMGMPSNVEVDDLVSYGILGLLDAIEKFEPSRGNKFKTYATTRIRGAIYDEIRKLDWIPRSIRKKAREVETAYRTIEERFGRAAADEEVADELGITVDELYERLTEISGTALLSLDNIFHIGKEDDEVSVGDIIAEDAELPDEILTREAMIDILAKAIEELPEKERLVLTLYYYEEMNLKEIGAVLGVTESRVSQIHTKAIMHLRSKLAVYREDFLEEMGK